MLKKWFIISALQAIDFSSTVGTNVGSIKTAGANMVGRNKDEPCANVAVTRNAEGRHI